MEGWMADTGGGSCKGMDYAKSLMLNLSFQAMMTPSLMGLLRILLSLGIQIG
jgi:hypothetical protein